MHKWGILKLLAMLLMRYPPGQVLAAGLVRRLPLLCDCQFPVIAFFDVVGDSVISEWLSAPAESEARNVTAPTELRHARICGHHPHRTEVPSHRSSNENFTRII